MTTLVETAPAPAVRAARGRLLALSERLLTTGSAVTLAVGALTLFVVNAFSSHLASDSYFTLYSGRHVFQHGIPHHEVLTTAAQGHAWIDQQWLAQLLYYTAWRVGGYALFVLLSSALVAVAATLLLRTLMRHGVARRVALEWTLVAVAGCLTNTVPRAQSFAYPLFVIAVGTVFTDSSHREWRPKLLLLVPTLIVWANLHGSVLMGAGMVAAYSGIRAVSSVIRGSRRSAAGYGLLTVLAAAAPLATPYGLSIVGYYRNVLGNPVLTKAVTEWRHPSLHDHISYPYFVVVPLVVLTVAIVAWRRRQAPALVPLAITTVLLLMSVRAIRNEIWFVLAGVMLAAMTAARPSSPNRTSDRVSRLSPMLVIGAASLVIGTVLMIARQPLSEFERGINRATLAAADRASADGSGTPILADESDASALLWLRPDTEGRVAFDIRYEQYSPAQLNAYANFLHGSNPVEVADDYGVVLLTVRDHEQTVRLLRSSPAWRLAMSSSHIDLFVRTGTR